MTTRLAGVFETVATLAGRLVPWLMVPLAALVFAVVVLRYGFDFGRIALQEGATYLHALILMLGMGYTLREKGHVRVDIFYSRMSRRRRAMVDLAGDLLLLVPTCLVIFIVSTGYVARSWRVLEGSTEAGGLPLVFVLKTLIPVMAVLLLIQGVADAIRNVGVLRR